MPPAQNTRSAAAKAKQPVLPPGKKWQCDHCMKATFDSYDKALRHERGCEERTVCMQNAKRAAAKAKQPAAPPGTKWQCDYCIKATFDSYDKALRHERGCEERTVRFTITEEYARSSGLTVVLAGGEGDDQQKYLSFAEDSPLFVYVRNVHAAMNALFSPNYERKYYLWPRKSHVRHGIFDIFRHFGEKHLHRIDVGGGATLRDINSQLVRTALSGSLWPGDAIKEVMYHDGPRKERLCLDNSVGNVEELAELLWDKSHYPLEITVEKRSMRSLELINNPLLQLRELDLCNNALVEEKYWGGYLIDGICQLHSLKYLRLDRNGISMTGCEALAMLMKRKESSLEQLWLRKNDIDDECVSTFAKALRGNTTLKALFLDHNPKITSTGWASLMNLICDRTSIMNTYRSNHTLQQLCFDERALERNLRDCGRRKDLLMLRANRGNSPDYVARVKIRDVHFKGECFDPKPLLDMDIKCMPHLLAWFINKTGHPDRMTLAQLNHIIRNWNIPMLLGFPSAEKIRIGSQVVVLEIENAHLKAQAAKMESMLAKMEAEMRQLRETNTELKDEVEALKGKKESPNRCLSKKRRVS